MGTPAPFRRMLLGMAAVGEKKAVSPMPVPLPVGWQVHESMFVSAGRGQGHGHGQVSRVPWSHSPCHNFHSRLDTRKLPL